MFFEIIFKQTVPHSIHGFFQLYSKNFPNILEKLSEENQKRLLGSMKTIESILRNQSKDGNRHFILRQHEPGDMGWVIFRNAVVYWDEYRWDERYEALVAKICADFINNFDAKRER